MPQPEFQSWTLRCLPSARREVGEWGSAWGGSWGSLGSVHGVVSSVFLPCQVLTTIEGIIDRAVAGLEQDQPARRVRAGEGNSSGMESAWDVHPLPAGVIQGCWGQLWSVPRSPWSAALGCPQQLSPTLGCPHF